MSSTWKCKSCDNTNSSDQANCMCGEDRPAYARPSAGGSGHGGCEVTGCPMPGGMSENFGKNARWYCRWHFGTKSNPVMSARITEDLIANRPKITGCKPNGELVNAESVEDMHKRIIDRNALAEEAKKKANAEKLKKMVAEHGS